MGTSGRNCLSDEKSPYLRAHAGNPVWWQPWGEEAFAAARAQNKPVFLSIGYHTCHWCHVMERESFADLDVAAALNRDFIAIKVDREERPDVDAIYMSAVQALSQHGGWPLSAFLTPEGKPFWGATYFSKLQFLQILDLVAQQWKDAPDELHRAANDLTGWLQTPPESSPLPEFDLTLWRTLEHQWLQAYDPQHGGRAGAPKFPPAYTLRALLRVYNHTGDTTLLQSVRCTLDHMARGGIYDHVGGGFHRYSTDEEWLVPHFEKMLYDQAALSAAYLEAYQVTREPEYAHVVNEILDYVLRDLAHPKGGFYAAEDADSEGAEGRFYVWTREELETLLSAEEFREIESTYGATTLGNFEDATNILNLQTTCSRGGRNAECLSALTKLRQARKKRVRPNRDEKILTSWNGLMIASLARAGAVLDAPRFTQAAAKAAEFVLKRLHDKKGNLLHRWALGEARYPAFLDDYAFFIDGLIELYQATFDARWLERARDLQQQQETLFGAPGEAGYYFSQTGDATLLRRGREYEDNVIPAGNSVAALNLLRLAGFFADTSLGERALRLMQAFPEAVKEFPAAFPQFLMAVDYALDGAREVAVSGDLSRPATKEMIAALSHPFNPNKVLAAGLPGRRAIPLLQNCSSARGAPRVFVCKDKTCVAPVTDAQAAVALAGDTTFYALGPV